MVLIRKSLLFILIHFFIFDILQICNILFELFILFCQNIMNKFCIFLLVLLYNIFNIIIHGSFAHLCFLAGVNIFDFIILCFFIVSQWDGRIFHEIVWNTFIRRILIFHSAFIWNLIDLNTFFFKLQLVLT